MSSFEIRVLGDFSVRCDGASMPLPQSRKTRALLAYLCVVGRPQRRERLCELFWDVPDDPRGALRWSLSKLRQILNADGEPRLVADRNMVWLKRGSVGLDYELIRGLSPDAIATLATGQLEAIASAFTGPFLSDLYLARCPAFEAWRVYCSNETEILRIKVLRALVDRLRDEPERALPHIHMLQTLLPGEDLDKEVARIGERARHAVASRSVGSASPSENASPVAERDERTSPPASSLQVAASSVRSNDEIRFTHARDGTLIAYAMSGSGPAVVLSSHWMSHLEFDRESPVWGHWIEALSSGFTLVRYDGRLNGLSEAKGGDISFEAFVDDLDCVIEAAGQDRFVLLGVSQGCAISVAYAARHPEKVAGLVLYGGYARGWRARGDPAEITRREAISVLMRQGWGQDDPMFRQLFTGLFVPSADRIQMDWFSELQRRTLAPENAWRLMQAFAGIDVSDVLEKLRVPTLVLHARADRVAPASQGLELARGIAGARFVELDSANHILLAEEEAFQRFVAETTVFANQVLRAEGAVPVDHRTRRRATILCVDFVGPDQAVDELHPEIALEMVDPLLMKAGELVRANRGTVLAISGNELTASFGAPEPLEGHAAFACRTALKLRDIALAGTEMAPRARVALDTGVVIVSHAGCPGPGQAEVRGGPVTVAHTLSLALRRDVVVATERTRSSAGGLVGTKPVTPSVLAELSSQPKLYEVTEIKRGRSRWDLRAEARLSPFIGREMQLQILNKAWHEARDGEGRTLVIVGDPGIGKSRVTHEFVGAIPGGEAEKLEAGALEIDLRSGFVVIRKILQGLFGSSDAEAPAIAIERTLASWSTLGLDRRLLDPILAVMELPVQDPAWATMSGQQRSRRMQEAAVALLLHLARARPVVLLVEDLHWIDPESEAILARLAHAVPTARFLLILTCRPEYDRTPFADTVHADLRLSAFSAAEAEALLDYLIGNDPTLARLRQNLSEACKGNALFLEETVRTLAETGKLEGEPGRYRSAGEVGEMAVSASIHAVIDARFERLEPDARHVAEIASIFGGEIPAISLRRMAALPGPRFDAALERLKKADLLVEVEVFPDALVRFKHALIRGAISERILAATLIELHRAALAELEAYCADRLDEHSERLARHAERAQLWGKAITYLLISAGKAIRRSAHTVALEQLQRGISLLRGNEVENADRQEIDFQLSRGVALMAARGWGSTEVLDAYQRAEELCEKLADQARLFTALRGRAQYYMLSGKPAAAQEVACRWLGLVEDASDPGLAIETEHMFWTNNFFLGETVTAHHHAERGIGLYDPGRDHHLTYKYSGHDPGVCCRCFSGLSAWLAGDPDKARQRCEEAIGLAGRLRHPLTTALALWGASCLHMFAAKPEQALPPAEEEMRIAEEFQLPLIIGQAAFQIGWAQFWVGEHEAGLHRMEGAISAIRATGAEMGLPYFIGLYAEALADRDSLEKADKTIDTALELGRNNGTYFQLAELLRIEALIRERRGAGKDEIGAMLHRAGDVASLQRSAIGQLRVALAQARLLLDGGDAARARGMIVPHADLVARLGTGPDALAAREFLELDA